MPTQTFKQVFFRPGRYHLGGGVYRDFTADDVRQHVRGAQSVLKAGHGIPILYEHAAPGSAEGSPVQLSANAGKSRRDILADQVKHGAGWVKRVWLTKDGEAAHELEVTDPDAAKGLKNKSIRFTSPEFRAAWTDGKGRKFEHLISHVALTHKPRALDQSAIEEVVTGRAPALQFSLADWAQLSSEEEMEEEKYPADDIAPDPDNPASKDREEVEDEAKDENPDLPAAEEDNANDLQFEAVLQLLKDEFGVSLPDDCDKDTFIRDLLTSLKTAMAVREKHEANDNAEKDDDDEPNPDDENDTVEEKPPIQFSLADVKAGKTSKLLSAVIRNSHEGLKTRLENRFREGTFPPALVKAISERAGAMQFSEDGEEFGTIKLAEVVELLEKGLPEGFYRNLTTDQGEQFSLENPPEGLLSKGDGEISADQAKKIVDEQAKHVPLLRARK